MTVCVLLSRVPFPLEKGDKLRAYHQLRLLRQHHRVVLCCLSMGKPRPTDLEALKGLVDELKVVELSLWGLIGSILRSLTTRLPWQVSYFYQPKAARGVEQWLTEQQPDRIYAQLVRTAPYISDRWASQTIFDFQDAFSAGMLRRAMRAPWYTRWFWDDEAKRLKSYESQQSARFKHNVIISEQDRLAIENRHVLPITVVPNGVDLKQFTPLRCPKTTDILFTGNMSYPPNVATALFIANEVLPRVRLSKPDVQLTICGADPVPAIWDLSKRGIRVTGWVDQIATEYHKSKVFFAPMQMGAGLQNKLLEAMACGIPCITSELAAKAFKKEHTEAFLVGKNAQEYAQLLVELLMDENKRNEIAQRGRSFVSDHYSWEAATAPLYEILGK